METVHELISKVLARVDQLSDEVKKLKAEQDTCDHLSIRTSPAIDPVREKLLLDETLDCLDRCTGRGMTGGALRRVIPTKIGRLTNAHLDYLLGEGKIVVRTTQPLGLKKTMIYCLPLKADSPTSLSLESQIITILSKEELGLRKDGWMNESRMIAYLGFSIDYKAGRAALQPYLDRLLFDGFIDEKEVSDIRSPSFKLTVKGKRRAYELSGKYEQDHEQRMEDYDEE